MKNEVTKPFSMVTCKDRTSGSLRHRSCPQQEAEFLSSTSHRLVELGYDVENTSATQRSRIRSSDPFET